MKKHAKQRRRFLPTVAMALLLPGCAGFEPVSDAAIAPYQEPRGGRATAFEGMTNRQQAEHLKRATFPQLNEVERALIIEINRDVNEDIHFLSDEENYGLPDFAMVEPPLRRPMVRGLPVARYGDCEDYALTKKLRLAKRGIHSSRLFVVRAEVPTSAGRETHVVLAVPEGSDWWILNNWDNRIEPASYLQSWWDWEFVWPRFDEYRQLARARNGRNQNNGVQREG